MKHDLTGRQFGKLAVIEEHGFTRVGQLRSRQITWRCKCTCGGETIVTTSSLIGGNTTSCGCHKVDMLRDRLTTHGLSKTPEYRAWINMRSRCENPRTPGYHRYGGRGIKVLYSSFDEFLADIGPRPSPDHSVDRIDNDGHYQTGNCRWSLPTAQNRNTSVNVELTWRGETKTLVEWSELLGIRLNTLIYRVRRGWSTDRALSQPVQVRGGYET